MLRDWPTAASADPSTIRRWWAKAPAANVGIVTGHRSGLFVVDLDEHKAGYDWGDLPLLPGTVQQFTGGGGRQLFFALPSGLTLPNTTGRIGPGIDTRGEGGYVVAPPSMHPSGRVYAWDVEAHYDDLPLAPVPPWLISKLQDIPRPIPSTPLPAAVPQGSRNAFLFKEASRLRRQGYAVDEITAMLAVPNQRCTPPLGTQELRTIAESAGKYAPANGTTPPQGGSFHQQTISEPWGLEGAGSVGTGAAADSGLPPIAVTTELSRWTDEGQEALRALTHPNGAAVVYQRARRIVLISRAAKPPRWIRRPPDAPVIVAASEAALYELASTAAVWQKWDKGAKAWAPCLPPKLFVQTLLGRTSWPFPPLEGIIHSPTLRPDGSLLSTPGYDADTGLYFDGNGMAYPSIPETPDIFDAQFALRTLKDVLCDFPWAGPSDCSAALSAILSGVCRHTVLGNIPLFGITATARASGKGLLADVIALIGTGRHAALWSQAEDDAEERKRLLALGMEGDPMVCIDNVTRPLGSASLDLALTAATFKDRILGTQTAMEVPMHAIFLATGNNLQYAGDLARRVVPIYLDPRMENPEERTNFTYPNLLAHIAQNRPALVSAALTILKAYFVDGCPSQGLSAYGSFQPWSDLIRAALVWAGEADPCEERQTIAAHDPGYEALAGLLDAWKACYPVGTSVTLKQLKHHIALRRDTGHPPAPNQWDDLEASIFEFDQGSARAHTIDTRTLGNAMRRIQGRVIDMQRLMPCGSYRRALQWRLETLDTPV